jgi:ABC-2 type transport system permease protein
MLKYLIEKEFKQFIRSAFLPKLVLVMPIMMMLILPWAADFEAKNINLVVVDNDHSSYSARLVQKAPSSGYFVFKGTAATYSQAMESIEEGTADIIMEIPKNFERDLIREGRANVLISANSVNGTKGSIGSSYLSMIVSSFADELRGEMGVTSSLQASTIPVINAVPQYRFNPRMEYKVFMVPALMVMLMTIISGFLPALNIVSEKEIGTIEQINVTPVSKFNFILAKLIPYWIIGFVVLTSCFLLTWLVYGLTPAGNLLTICVSALIYVLALSGFGLVISNYSNTMQQAMFVIFFFMMILVLMSGLFTPVKSMPQWAQNITIFNPLKYFIEIMRSVYLRGSAIGDIFPDILALCGFAVVSNVWAVVSYKKTN